MTARVNVHQHLCPEPLLAAPRRPPAAPGTGGCCASRRARVARGSGRPRSPCAGRCWSRATASTARSWRCRARSGLDRPDPGALADRLDEGFVGLCLPAGALCGPQGAARCAPLFSTLEERGSPLFVHPGPAPWSAPPSAGRGSPGWWPAMTTYVAQIHAVWVAFRAWVRPAHPRLRACFAMLAGLARLHSVRLGSRGVAWARRTPRSSSTRRRPGRARSPPSPPPSAGTASSTAPTARSSTPPVNRSAAPVWSSTARAPAGSSPPRRCSRDRTARPPAPARCRPPRPGQASDDGTLRPRAVGATHELRVRAARLDTGSSSDDPRG